MMRYFVEMNGLPVPATYTAWKAWVLNNNQVLALNAVPGAGDVETRFDGFDYGDTTTYSVYRTTISRADGSTQTVFTASRIAALDEHARRLAELRISLVPALPQPVLSPAWARVVDAWDARQTAR